MKSSLRWNAVVALLGLALLCVFAFPLWERGVSGQNDFLQLYAGARLAGSPDLYNPEASKRIHREVTGGTNYLEGVYYTRLPFYALLLSPLASLPYTNAYWIFQVISLSAVGSFLYFYTRLYPQALVAAAFSIALLVNFANGQDSGIVTAIAGFSLLLARRRRDFLAGLLMSLAAIKFHLFLLVPLVVIAHRRWKYLLGGAAGGAVLLIVSTLTAGLDWPAQFLATVRSPELHAGADRMTTLRNLVWFVTGGDHPPLELALGLVSVVIILFCARRLLSFESAFALALLGGLLTAHHTYAQDLTLALLPAFLLAVHPASKPLRGLAFAAASPIPCLLLFLGHPLSVFVPVLLVAILIAGLAYVLDGQSGARSGNPVT